MLTTSKDVEGKEVKEVTPAQKQLGFMTYEEAEVQMKHGHMVRRAAWPVDVHLVDGKMVGYEPIVEAEDPNHDPADSNPDATRAARRYADIISGKEMKKREAAKREPKKLEKEDKAANDWTYFFPKDDPRHH